MSQPPVSTPTSDGDDAPPPAPAPSRRKAPKDRRIAYVLAVALVAAFLWSQRTRAPETSDVAAADATPRAVATVRCAEVTVPVLAEGIGTVRSRRQTTIAARVLAEVLEVAVSPGDRVERGQLLVVLDDRDLAARRSRAAAELRVADERLADAETEWQRVENLLARQAATQQDEDRASAARAGALAQRDAAQQALVEAEVALADARVTAPFAGLVHARLVDPGDLAAPGRPLLELHDPDALRLEAQVEEGLLGRVRAGEALRVDVDALGLVLDGVVDEIVPAVDPATRTGTVKIALPNDGALWPGMFGRARIVVGERQALVVPEEALVRRGQLELLFGVDAADGGSATQGRARLLLVRAGAPIAARDGGPPLVEILAGVPAGAIVVGAGAQELWDGAPVDVRSGPAPER